LNSLDRGLERAQSAPDDEELRDGAIQRFDILSFRDLIRLGAERGFIEEPSEWFEFREERNISSHTYDEAKAAEVYASALRFSPVARRLLEKLEARIS